MPDLNWNGVYGFWLVAHCGSFSKAAKVLPRGSVQGLHKRVQALEGPQNLNLRLLRSRGVRGVELTEAGKRLYDLINPVFSEFDKLASELRGEDRGPLHVAATTFSANNYVPYLVREFGPGHPEVTVHLHIAEHEELELLLETRRVDFIICAPKVMPDNASVLASTPLRFGLVLPHAEACTDNPSWQDVLMHPLILPERTSVLRQAFEELVIRHRLGGAVQRRAEVTSPELAVEAVRAGMGIALVAMGPKLATELTDVRFLPAPGGLPELTLMLMSRRDRYMPRYMRNFIEITKRVFGSVGPYYSRQSRRSQ